MANKSEDFIKTTIAKLGEEIGVLREMAQGQSMSFSCLDDQQIEAKLRGVTAKTPFIYAQSWTSATQAGTTAFYNVYVLNPDPHSYHPVYATIYFGLGNFLSIGDGWGGRDKRWVEFSSDRTFLGAGSTHGFGFQYRVPYVPLGTYNGNCVVWRGSWHDIGDDFDRGSFDIKVMPSIAIPVPLPTPVP